MMADIDAPSKLIQGEYSGFLLSLIIISSYLIQSDGKIMHSELEYLREFLGANFGAQKKERYIRILLNLFEKSKKYSYEEWTSKIRECAIELIDYTTEEQRMLLMSFLIKIVKADRKVECTEIKALQAVSEWLQVNVTLSEKIDRLKLEEVWAWII